MLNKEQRQQAEKMAAELAPLAIAELMKKEGNSSQKANARRIGEIFADCGAVCGGSLWMCGDKLAADLLTLPDGFRVRAFGRMCAGGCFIIILEDIEDEDKERAYLVRPNW